MPRAIVHIGTHKTGTTTFQRWADLNRAEILEATGFRYYESMYPSGAPSAHFEIALACLRPERMFHARRLDPTWSTPAFDSRLREHLRAQLDGGDLIISCEDLSLIRHRDEVDRLRALLPGYDLEFIVVRREPGSFVESYRKWMVIHGLEPSSDPSSYLYIEPDSWLLELDSLGALLPDLRWVDYHRAMATDASIIPALYEGMGFDRAGIPNWRVPPLNSGGGLTRWVNRLRWRRLRRR